MMWRFGGMDLLGSTSTFQPHSKEKQKYKTSLNETFTFLYVMSVGFMWNF